MRAFSPRIPALLLLVATSLGAGAARGDAASVQAAEKLFQEGMALLEKGNPGAACPKLEESYKLDPAIGTQFRLADCLERQGRLAASHEVFVEVAEQSKRFGDAGKEATARARATALEPRLGRLVVEAPTPPPAGLSVTVAGAPLDRALWGKERWADPAPGIKVRAEAAGFEGVEVDVKVEAGAVARARLPTLRALGEVPVGPPKGAPPPRVEPPPNAASSGVGQRIAGILVGGAGVVALGVGIGFGVLAKSTYDAALKNECGDDPKSCSAAGRAQGQEAFAQSYASTGLFVGGGVAVGVGLIVLLTAPSGSPRKQARQPRPSPLVLPAVAADGGGLSVLGEF